MHRHYNFLGMPVLLVGATMRRLLERVERLALADAAVLVVGETGTGKEWVARALHAYSGRSEGPWVDISCTTLPEHLAESELFGHERGAFSGAVSSKPGLFEMASDGTLLLDEIGDLDPRMQTKLLRVLDGAGYYRLGGIRKVDMRARVVAATHRSLEALVASGRFREDLYHRLNLLTIEVPPLRYRREEIAPLATYFLAQAREGYEWAPEALKILEEYAWPGNVRELRNVVWKMAWDAAESPIPAAAIPERLQMPEVPESVAALAGGVGGIPLRLDEAERKLIGQALDSCGGRRAEAARRLGISRRTLSRKLNRTKVEQQ